MCFVLLWTQQHTSLLNLMFFNLQYYFLQVGIFLCQSSNKFEKAIKKTCLLWVFVDFFYYSHVIFCKFLYSINKPYCAVHLLCRVLFCTLCRFVPCAVLCRVLFCALCCFVCLPFCVYAVLCPVPFCACAVLSLCRFVMCRFVLVLLRDVPFCLCICYISLRSICVTCLPVYSNMTTDF